MKIAIMQPYFLPYIGYWQLINAVETFVIYDNIQYSKKGWINRNRIGDDEFITLSLKKDSGYLNIDRRLLSDTWKKDRGKIMNRLESFYGKAINFDVGMRVADDAIVKERMDLFTAIEHSLRVICEYLDIQTPFVTTSTLDMDHSLKRNDRVKGICKALNAKDYINAIGGQGLYSKQDFVNDGIKLRFLKARNITYPRKGAFLPFMSILDIIMFTTQNQTKQMLKEYDLL